MVPISGAQPDDRAVLVIEALPFLVTLRYLTTAPAIESYVLFSDAAAREMNIDAALVPYSQNFEHFGDVPMQVYDLARAWENFRKSWERDFISEADGVWTFRWRFDFAPAAV